MARDRYFPDAELVELYDVLNPWDPSGDSGFYLERVLAARAVLDVGCGTGTLLHRARRAGHTGRLCGLDPATDMLGQARRVADVEWVLGDLGSVGFDQEFDLVVMTGHAFQELLDDDELRVALAAVRAALTDDGRFVFETRNPLARAWLRWSPDRAVEVTTPGGVTVRTWHEVDTPVDGDRVWLTTTFARSDRDQFVASRGALRFLGAEAVAAALADAGLAVEEQFGDWDESPLTDTSPEIITVARRR